MKIKIKNESHRYYINRPRSKHEHRWVNMKNYLQYDGA